MSKVLRAAKSVWIVVVNYRTAGLAIECLRFLSESVSDFENFHAEVVDNASGDGSVETLRAAIKREHWGDWASVQPLDRNGGFAFGNNAGIRKALQSARRVDYVMLVNPDAFVARSAVTALVDFMNSHVHVGIAGSRLEDAMGEAQCSAHNAFSPLGELELGARLGALSRALSRHTVSPPRRDAPHECDWVSGASLVVRREVFESIGLLDEGYFLYFEEADFCLRARRAGWNVWYVPASRVVHLEGASTGIRDAERRRPRYWFDSRRRYFVKHFGLLSLVIADVLWTIGRLSLVLRRILRLGPAGEDRDPKWFAVDLLLGDLRSILSGALWEVRKSNRRL